MIMFFTDASSPASNFHHLSCHLSDTAQEPDLWKTYRRDEGGMGIATVIAQSPTDTGVIVSSVEERNSSSRAQNQHFTI